MANAHAKIIKECMDAHGNPGLQGLATNKPWVAGNNVELLRSLSLFFISKMDFGA